MSQTPRPDDRPSEYQPPSETAEAERSRRTARPRRGNPARRAAIAAVIAAVLVAVIQALAARTDYQHAFFATVAVSVTALLYAGVQLHRLAAAAGHRRIVPLSAAAVLVALVALLRIDGFTGEMVPILRWRFAGDPTPPLEKVSDSPDRTAIDASRPAAAAEADSIGFLGNDRTGTAAERAFAVPESAEQVKTLWRQGVGDGWASFAVQGDRAVTLEQRGGEEAVTAYRLADGALLWIRSRTARHEHPYGGVGPRSTPTISAGAVYAQGATGYMWCLDLETGQVRWTADLLELAGWDQEASEASAPWGRAGSPLLVDGLCVLPLGAPENPHGLAADGRSLVALDAESGQVRWSAGEDQISYASPQLMTLGGVRQIVSVNEASITGHRIENGEVLWSYPWPGQSNGGATCSAAVPAGENRFLVGKGYGGGSALVEIRPGPQGGLDAETVWASPRLLKTKFNHSCVDGDVAYGLSNGTLEAVNLSGGRRLWRQSRGARYGQGQLLLAGDTLVVQAESGDVAFVAADPSEYRELGRLPALDAKTWNIPTLAGRHLLVRNDREAICYLLPEKEGS